MEYPIPHAPPHSDPQRHRIPLGIKLERQAISQRRYLKKHVGPGQTEQHAQVVGVVEMQRVTSAYLGVVIYPNIVWISRKSLSINTSACTTPTYYAWLELFQIPNCDVAQAGRETA